MTFCIKRVRTILKSFGLRKLKGNGEGHERWGNDAGRTCRPRLVGREIHLRHLYAMGDELAANGICSRHDFINAVRGR